MSELLRQLFQRGRGTAPHLHPRPLRPFEAGAVVGETEAGRIEQQAEIEYSPMHPIPAAAAPAPIGVPNPVSAPLPTADSNALGTQEAAFSDTEKAALPAALPMIDDRQVAFGAGERLPAPSPSLQAAMATSDSPASPAAAKARRRTGATPAVNPIDSQTVSGPTPSTGQSIGALIADPIAADLPLAASARAIGSVGASNDGPTRSAVVDMVAPPATLAAASPPAETSTAARTRSATPSLTEPATPVAAAPPVKAIAAESAPLAPAAPPAEKSAVAISGQTAPASSDPPRIEIRIGRIDVQVPAAAPQSDQRPVAIGMSLDAFIAETRQ